MNARISTLRVSLLIGAFFVLACAPCSALVAVTLEEVPLRAAPHRGAAIIRSLPRGDHLLVEMGDGAWCAAQAADGRWGCVEAASLRPARFDDYCTFQTAPGGSPLFDRERGRRIASIPGGEHVVVLWLDAPIGPDVRQMRAEREWFRVLTRDGRVGFVPTARLLNPAGRALQPHWRPKRVSLVTGLSRQRAVLADVVAPDGYANVREAPQGRLLVQLTKNERCLVSPSAETWLPVATKSGVLGWIHRSQVRCLSRVSGIPAVSRMDGRLTRGSTPTGGAGVRTGQLLLALEDLGSDGHPRCRVMTLDGKQGVVDALLTLLLPWHR